MKRIALPLIIAFMIVWALPAHALVDAKVGYGTSFKLDGVLQWQTYGYWGERTEDSWTFQIPRLRLMMSGTLVNENISYFVELDPTNGQQGNMDCYECGSYDPEKTASSSSSLEAMLLDVKINFAGIIPNTVVTFGRFKPAWSYFMPRNTADLYLINIPVVTQMYGMWRQVGIQSTTTTDFVDAYLGFFNGRGDCWEDLDTTPWPHQWLGSNNWTDNNKYKDIFAKVVFKYEGFFLAPSFWYGWPHDSSDYNYYILGGEIGYVKDGLTVIGEFQTLHYDDDGEDYDSMGGYFHVGYFFLEDWEGIFRFDYFDFLDDDDLVKDDENMYFTVGANYFPDTPVNAKISLEYQLGKYGDAWVAPNEMPMTKTTSSDDWNNLGHQLWLQISVYF